MEATLSYISHLLEFREDHAKLEGYLALIAGACHKPRCTCFYCRSFISVGDLESTDLTEDFSPFTDLAIFERLGMLLVTRAPETPTVHRFDHWFSLGAELKMETFVRCYRFSPGGEV